MKRFPLLTLLAGAAMVLGSCAPSIDVTTNYDPKAAFSTFKTYAWASGNRLNLVNPLPDDPAIERAIHDVVERELAKKGYTKTTPQNADFLVGYAGTTNRMLKSQTVDAYYGYQSDPTKAHRYTWGGSPEKEAYLDQYDEGSLILDASTNKPRKLVWRGYAQTALLKNPSEERTRQRIELAVRKILAKFPPK